VFDHRDNEPGTVAEQIDDSEQELKREIIEFVKMITWFLVLFFVLKTFVIEVYEVQGPSMLPTLETDDRILVFKLPSRLSRWRLFSGLEPLDPGDIVVFDNPEDVSKRYVKRVVAKGPPRRLDNTVVAQENDPDAASGPRVSVVISEGAVFVNNQRVPKDLLPDDSAKHLAHVDEVLLAPGEFYVLGDNLAVSKDSRSFKAVDRDLVVGKAVLRIWPLTKFGLLR